MRAPALLLALLLAACGGPDYHMSTPDGFKRFEKTDDFRFISADGVILSGREVENYPKADLAFWTDALKNHLDQRGYTLKSEQCFETTAGLPGCTVDFLVPYGAEDWVMSETLFVVGERVVLLEAAGPFDRYTPLEAAVNAAVRTFQPGD